MRIFLDNWALILVLLGSAGLLAFQIKDFLKLSPEDQLVNLRNWLLFAVVQAEKELGSGTGRIKLAYVYKMFLDTFPKYAEIITFETFSKVVDTALDEMKAILANNTNLKSYIEE